MEYTDEDLEQSIEETRHDIEDKRTSMSEKLELLEERVRDTLQETRSAVEGIVENVKETVDETVVVVKETVEGARSTVDNLVENVKGTMDDTAVMVKQSFDLYYQVEQRPWLMVGGSVMVGYLLGSWMYRGSSYQSEYSEREYSSEDDNILYTAPVRSGASFDDLEESVDTHEKRDASDKYRASVKNASHAQPRPWSNFLGPFQEEWDALKGVALGTLMGTLRTMVRQHMPAVAPKLEQAINSASAKLGAEPIDFPSAQDQSPDNNDHTQSHASHTTTPEGQGSQASSSSERSAGVQRSEPLAAKGSPHNQYR
jgi:ElaB/YqjD/DUF883 family membrane-anchored ribosome-binding protein